MTLDETIAACRFGTLEMDVPRFVLRRIADDDDDEMIGPGTLRQEVDGQIGLKCHVAFPDPQRMINLVNDSMNIEAGTLFADRDYFEVSAIDAHGALWDFGRVLTSNSISLPMMSGTIIANPKRLQRKEIFIGEGESLRIYFLNQNRRDWEAVIDQSFTVSIGSLSFTIRIILENRNQVKVVANCDQPFPVSLERRLVEALQFIIGQSLRGTIVDEITGSARTLSVYGNDADVRRVHSLPPLEIHDNQYTAHVIELFGSYFRYLMSLPDEGIWSPPSSFLSLLRRSSESSLDGWTIGLCVSVEGLAGLIEFDPPELIDELAKFQRDVTSLLVTEKISDGVRRRIEGLMGQLDAIRPRDRMMSLVPDGGLFEDDIKAWSRARNRAVHTRKAGITDLKRDNLQQKMDEIYRVYRLLYSIVFHVIGYRGSYSDYAERGFPVKNYPSAPIDTPKESAC